jgi:putative transcriptional regulator
MGPAEIKNKRKAMNLTQVQFASAVGVSFVTLNRWESGKTKPSKSAIKKIISLRGEELSTLSNEINFRPIQYLGSKMRLANQLGAIIEELASPGSTVYPQNDSSVSLEHIPTDHLLAVGALRD